MNLGVSAWGLSNQAHVVARQIAFSRPREDVILQVNQTAAFKDLPSWHLPSMTGPSTPLKPRCCHKPTANYVWNWVLIELLQSMPQPNLFSPPPTSPCSHHWRETKALLARRVAPSINATHICKTLHVTAVSMSERTRSRACRDVISGCAQCAFIILWVGSILGDEIIRELLG